MSRAKTTSKPASTLLHRLDGVREMGAGRWIAKCSAHDDRNPSLSIRDTGDKMLIHCFAGCSAEDVLAAVGLTFRDLYEDPWTAAYRAATAKGATRLQPPDPLEVERLVVEIGRADLETGRRLFVEDLARYKLALDRLRTTGMDAA